MITKLDGMLFSSIIRLTKPFPFTANFNGGGQVLLQIHSKTYIGPGSI